MGVKKHGNYEFDKMEKRMPNLNFLKYSCPHCIDEEGNFSEIILYVPKDDEHQIATQCNCNGQEDRCTVMITLMKSYNSENFLKKLNIE